MVDKRGSVPVHFNKGLSCSSSKDTGDGRVVRWCLGNFQSLGVLLILIIVGQGPTALTAGAVEVWTFFLSSIISLFCLPLSLGGGLLILIIVGRGPTALTVDADGGLEIFALFYHSLFCLPLSLGD